MYICIRFGNKAYFLTLTINNFNQMKKEIRTDLYTQTAYAKLICKSVPWVHKLIKENKVNTLTVNGAVLIKK